MSATADSSCGELSEAKHLWSISLSGLGRKIDPRWKAWPRGLRPLRCSFSRVCGIRMTVENDCDTMKWIFCQLGAREHYAVPRALNSSPDGRQMAKFNLSIRELRVLSSLPNGNLPNMKTTVTVDEVGRMVLPKPVREAIGISGRTNVTIEIVSRTAQIAVIDRRNGPVTRRRGRTVYAGPLPPEWDSGEAISRMRERRNRQ
jgi:bifunctional DNA-binding transcriptional regulator/antitoxin component of YhaV-PrlF toxin-antitoxin module